MFLSRRFLSWLGESACVALLCLWVAPLHAQAQPEAPHSNPAPLVVMNRTIVTFRVPFLGFEPADRAREARERIEELLARQGPADVSMQAIPQGILVKIDDALAFGVTSGDVNTLHNDTLETTASRAADALRGAINETRELRDTRSLLKSGAIAVALTLGYLALLWLLALARRRIGYRLGRIAKAKTEQLHLHGVQLIESDWALDLVRRLTAFLFWALALLLTYEWTGRVLELFPYTRPWGERLNGFLVDTAAKLVGGIAGAIPELLIAAVIFVLARFVVGLLHRFFDRVASGRVDFGWVDPETARPTRRLLTIVVWLLALVMAYPYLPGASTDAFKGLSVLVGLMVSIGGASVVGQMLSGTILTYTRTFRVGEYVRIGEHEGVVVELGMYRTRLRTGIGEELTLPNSMVLETPTRNFSRNTADRSIVVLDTSATIGYDTPWRQVHEMLKEAARRTTDVLAEPAPEVYQTALSDFYVEYRLVAHGLLSQDFPRIDILGRLHQNVQDVFNEHGVQIMSPHYLGDPDEAKIVPQSRWFEAPARHD
ncbi:mechanosensitive ion channel family protein [Variovorax sp. YR216]|uniref:mechanosensitive ion channel family protein n=1 Tax=Variovorax sp. YR216 TaxID=1882828 RepID=UPI00089586A4|nr:mechanosensitive ion channel family protein [Variovorax sp. YR216]SEA89974.1 Mechanosensitive ion channel [Variovorax sp. YR216]